MRQDGFTLVEAVLTLVLAGFLAAMVLPYMISGVVRSVGPTTTMNTPLALETVMGKIITDYNSNANYLHDLTLLAARIQTGNYGITTSHTVTKNVNFKFDASDVNTALLVTIVDNATNESVTYVFTRQL